jgi:hypothetical protein
MFSDGLVQEPSGAARRFSFSHSPAKDGKMHQRLPNKDLEMTIVSTDRRRSPGMRHILAFVLLGGIFALSMMLVIFAS